MRSRLVPLLLALGLAVPLAGCGGSGSGQRVEAQRPALTSEQPPGATATTPTTTTPSTTTTPAQTTTTPATTTTTTPAQTTPGSPSGATGGAPATCPGAIGGFVRDVHAGGTDCNRARDVASAWFDAVHGGAAPDSTIQAGGYSCSGALAGERASVTCTAPSGGSKVSFTASP